MPECKKKSGAERSGIHGIKPIFIRVLYRPAVSEHYLVSRWGIPGMSQLIIIIAKSHVLFTGIIHEL